MTPRSRVTLARGVSLWFMLATVVTLAAFAWPQETPAEGVAAAFVVPRERELSAAERLVYGLSLDVNAASSAELALLEVVGPKLAEAIVAYRESHGRFASIDELDAVPGVGIKKLAALRMVLTTGYGAQREPRMGR